MLLFAGAAAGQSTETFTLSSNAALDGGTLPPAYTCDGTGSTLPLEWTGAPAGTREFALLMTTVPGDGTTKWNWVLYGIPRSAKRLDKDSFLVGTAGVGSDGPGAIYDPPCSRGPGPKLYTWTLYALSEAPVFKAPAGSVTGEMVSEAIRGITVGKASINLRYSRRADSPGSSVACGYIANSMRASRSGAVSVSCDGTFAYVSSMAIPAAPMMNGITGTNLQVPVPQDFLGEHGWRIPLQPAIAETPTYVVDGPIGVAVNGVPIFNPCTQGGCVTGGDTKVLGQLDTCNGHAGRADDYHYHAAPTCLMAERPAGYWDTHPVGWALDGFASFGYRDADGTEAARDSTCGGNSKAVPNAPQGYSYHLTDASPYVMTCLIGVPSPDLAIQGSKYRPMRQPPVRPFRVSGMTLEKDAADGYEVLQFTSSIPFVSSENGADSDRNSPGTYRVRYKQVTGTELENLLARPRNRNATSCWYFEFTDGAEKTTQPPVSYCK